MNELNKTAGGIVIGDGGAIAMVMSANSQSWLFPKGHLDPAETDEEAAIREIAEETGLTNLEYIADLGSFERIIQMKDNGEKNRVKEIHMFLLAAQPHASITVPENMKGEIIEAKWVPFREVAQVLGTPHTEWFTADRAWFATVFDRVKQAIQRD